MGSNLASNELVVSLRAEVKELKRVLGQKARPNTKSQSRYHQKRRKNLVFEPVMNIRDDVEMDNEDDNMFFKCSINAELGLLAMNCGSRRTPDKIVCVDLADNTVAFTHRAYGRYSHHWIKVNGRHVLSVQTKKNTLSMFTVDEEHEFAEDKALKLELARKDVIDFCQFDASFSNLFVVRNKEVLERRSVSDLGTVSVSIALKKRVRDSVSELIAVSEDGKWCVVVAGGNAYVNSEDRLRMFYLIDIDGGVQTQLMTKALSNSYAPVFINGRSDFVAIGGGNGEGVEIWSVAERKLVRHLDVQDDSKFVSCTFSANDILAVGLGSITSGAFRLWDTRTWRRLHGVDCNMTPRCIDLTADSKMMAMAGSENEKCVVLKIQ